MAPTVPTGEPTSIVAGDSVAFLVTLKDYTPGDGWTLKYRLLGDGFDSTATADTTTYAGQYYLVFAASVTASATVGQTARLFGWVESGLSSASIFAGMVDIEPNLRLSSSADLVTIEVTQLAAAEAALTELVATSNESYSVGSRSAVKRKIREQIAAVNALRFAVWRQNNPGQSFPQNANRFVNA